MTAVRLSGGAARDLPDGERGGPAAVVEEMLKLLGKAVRAHQLYLHNNPTYQRALELLRRSFAPVWEQLPEVLLQVTEQALVWEGRPVYQEADRAGDTLPWLLYKDGVRELRLLPGLEGEEIERLLDVVRRLGRSARGDDDAITLLWERDFAFLRYRFVEPAPDEGAGVFRLAPQPGVATAGFDAAPAVAADDAESADAAGEVASQRSSGIISLVDFDATPYFLAERELAYLRDGIAEEYAQDLFGDVVAMLLDTFETQPSRRARDEVCAALEELLLQALGSGDYAGVGMLLREVGVTVARVPSLAPEHRERLTALAGQLGAEQGLGRLVEALDVAEVLPAEAELEALFGQLGAPALGPLLGRVRTVQSARLRAVLVAVADRLALEHSAELVRLVGSEHPGIALEAARRAGALKAAAAVPALADALQSGSPELRATAAQALAEIGSTGALQQLAAQLGHADRDVRLAALRAVGARGYRAALPALDALVRARRAREADLTEQMALFDAYGALCGDDGVALLDGLLNGRSLLGRRQEPTVRACAAVALGRVGSERARAALGRAADEKDVVVRTAVQRALRSGA